MGFSKAHYQDEVEVVITHPLYPDAPFTFFFPKKTPQAALDATARYVGLTDDVLDEVRARAFVEMLTTQMSREPLGFDDLPRDERPLQERLTEYFDDPGKPELLEILLEAKRIYKEGTTLGGYFKSVQNSGAGADQSTSSSPQT